jgi:hypothetical protein
MKKAVVPLGFAIALSFASFSQTLSSVDEDEHASVVASIKAQPTASAEDTKAAKTFMKNLNEELTLNETQKKDLYQIELEKNILLKQVEAEFEAQMKTVLTAAQFSKWKKSQSVESRYIYNP